MKNSTIVVVALLILGGLVGSKLFIDHYYSQLAQKRAQEVATRNLYRGATTEYDVDIEEILGKEHHDYEVSLHQIAGRTSITGIYSGEPNSMYLRQVVLCGDDPKRSSGCNVITFKDRDAAKWKANYRDEYGVSIQPPSEQKVNLTKKTLSGVFPKLMDKAHLINTTSYHPYEKGYKPLGCPLNDCFARSGDR